ncbi:MAG: signal peptide peptidase SppA [bacterium]|nr:signal peptide peptidase SppA [bacterium]
MSPKSFLGWIGALSMTFFVVIVLLPLMVVLTLSGFAKYMSPDIAISGKTVAVIELDGVILDSKDVLEQLYKQSADDKVKGIVLRVNSPGGAIGPAQEIYSAVKKIKEKKPVIASMGTVAASGGLYASLGATKIFCQPGTLTGSIGVIMQMPNVRKISDLIGFEMLTIKSGALKDAGNPFREITEQDKSYLQGTVNEAFEQFVEAVAESRKLDMAKVREFSDGRIILGSDAVKLGIADGFGDIDSAARAVFEELKDPLADTETPTLIYPMDDMKWLKKFISISSEISQLLQGTVKFQYIM